MNQDNNKLYYLAFNKMINGYIYIRKAAYDALIIKPNYLVVQTNELYYRYKNSYISTTEVKKESVDSSKVTPKSSNSNETNITDMGTLGNFLVNGTTEQLIEGINRIANELENHKSTEVVKQKPKKRKNVDADDDLSEDTLQSE